MRMHVLDVQYLYLQQMSYGSDPDTSYHGTLRNRHIQTKKSLEALHLQVLRSSNPEGVDDGDGNADAISHSLRLRRTVRAVPTPFKHTSLHAVLKMASVRVFCRPCCWRSCAVCFVRFYAYACMYVDVDVYDCICIGTLCICACICMCICTSVCICIHTVCVCVHLHVHM